MGKRGDASAWRRSANEGASGGSVRRGVAYLLERLVAVLGVADVWEAVALLDALLGEQMLAVRRVVRIRQAPLVRDELAARLEDPKDLAVDVGAVGGVAARLDGVAVVEGGVVKGHVVEVGLHQSALVVQPRLRAQDVAAIHLVLVECDAGHSRARELADVAQRATDAAAAVEHVVARLHAESHGQVVLMPRDRLQEVLARELLREVEGLAPAPLVEVGGQVVVRVDEVDVGRVTTFDRRLVIVVKVVVLVDVMAALARHLS